MLSLIAKPGIKWRPISFWGVFALVLFLLPLIGFPLRALVQPERLPPMRLELHIHALTTGGWFALVLFQSVLISARNIKLHRWLGWASIALSILLLVSGVIISVQFYERTGIFLLYLGSLVSLGMFALFFTLGIVKRKDRLFHARMMIFAAIACLPPAFNRFAFVLDVSPLAVSGPLWLLVAALVPAYDLLTMRRLTRGSIVGIAAWIAALAIMGAFGGPHGRP